MNSATAQLTRALTRVDARSVAPMSQNCQTVHSDPQRARPRIPTCLPVMMGGGAEKRPDCALLHTVCKGPTICE
jgi:hypothetical protein